MDNFVKNTHLVGKADDFLYHLGYSKSQDLQALFGDVKFVCCGGSANRMRSLCGILEENLKDIIQLKEGSSERNLCSTDRYAMYKVGPVICISHGMGVPSMSIMLIEMLKLIHYAGCHDVTFIRVGTSGGIGVEPGTVVVSSGAVNGLLQSHHNHIVLGKVVEREASLDSKLADHLLEVGRAGTLPVASGKTMCTDDFYEGAIVCVTILDRLLGDQVKTPKAQIKEFEQRPCQLVASYIRKQVEESNK